ncbi:RNA helicase [Enterococcus sp. ARL09-542]|nr:RNA helicase [Enterococcus sp. ARL09-542]
MLVENRLRFSTNTKYYRTLYSKGFQGVCLHLLEKRKSIGNRRCHQH